MCSSTISVAVPPQHLAGTVSFAGSRVDRDGNETSGVRSVELQVPMATYAGWNLRAKGFIEDELCYLNGSYIPFAKTKEEREKSSDPRPSVEERYKDHAEYIQMLSLAAQP